MRCSQEAIFGRQKLLVRNPRERASLQPCERRMAENSAANLCAYSEQSIFLLRPVFLFFFFFSSRLLRSGASRLWIALRMRSDPPRIAAGGLWKAIRGDEIIDWRWYTMLLRRDGIRCCYVDLCAESVRFNSSEKTTSVDLPQSVAFMFLSFLTVTT